MLFSLYSKFIFWNSNNYQDSGVVENTKKLEPLIIIDVRTDWNCNINWGSNMDRVLSPCTTQISGLSLTIRLPGLSGLGYTEILSAHYGLLFEIYLTMGRSSSGVVVVERLERSLQFLFSRVERRSSSCFICFWSILIISCRN